MVFASAPWKHPEWAAKESWKTQCVLKTSHWMYSLPDILNAFDGVIDNVSGEKLCPNLQISGQCIILSYSVDSFEM